MTTDTMTHCGIPTAQPKEWAPMTEREHKLVDWIRLHGTRTSRDLAALLGITVDASCIDWERYWHSYYECNGWVHEDGHIFAPV